MRGILRSIQALLLALAMAGTPAAAALADRSAPAASSVDAETATARFRAQADEYLAADPAGKQRWLEQRLLHEAEPAGRLYLDDQQFAALQARHRAILSHSAAGHALSRSGVLRLLSEVDQQQRAAIAQLRRDYTFAIAQAFHDNRAEFDRWYNAWDRIESAYATAGHPTDWHARMIAWLERANQRPALAARPAAPPQLAARVEAPARLPSPALPREPAGQAPAAPPAPPLPTSRPAPIRAIPPRIGPQIDRGELEARITGFNLATNRLIARLHAQQTWSFEELRDAVHELSDLAQARHDLELYWNVLPRAVQVQMIPLQSLDGALALLATRTSERRRELEFSPASATDRSAWELRRLDDVSRQLAALATPRS